MKIGFRLAAVGFCLVGVICWIEQQASIGLMFTTIGCMFITLTNTVNH